MLPLAKTVASMAPEVFDKADRLAKKVSGGKGLIALATGKSGDLLTGELLVKSGMNLNQLKSLMDGMVVQNREAIYSHAAGFVQEQMKNVSDHQVKTRSTNTALAIESDIVAMEIKTVIRALGLSNVDDLFKVVTVLNSLTIDQVQMYKGKGSVNPALGYF